MSLLEQLSASQSAPPLEGVLLSTGDLSTGMLGNVYAQSIRVSAFDVDSVIENYSKLLSSFSPSFKLAMLKRQKFTLEGRRNRIEMALAALNAPQPTDLTLAQWKALLEEVEDED